ncbi:MAG: hypothetical protein ACXW18_05975, partial [Pyrinomonadaceae bacterium]
KILSATCLELLRIRILKFSEAEFGSVRSPTVREGHFAMRALAYARASDTMKTWSQTFIT